MKSNTFMDAVRNRRSYYRLSSGSPVADEEIIHLLEEVVTNVPSAFNSQSARLVLLLGDRHRKMWDITLDVLRKVTPEKSFARTKEKVEGSFASGHGTVLFYEDMDVIEDMQKKFPVYADSFRAYSDHTSAMHQFVVWTSLEEMGFGASLQHYNPLIDKELAEMLDINPKWRLVAQMPFGIPEDTPGEKEIYPLDRRLFIFR
jgi:hypothetical protein